jgi:hypothetical protein
MKRLIVLLALVFLGGCAAQSQKAETLAHNSGWTWSYIPSGDFDLAAAWPPERHGDLLWVYLEGDGRAYLNPATPSTDPTPTDPVALRLALVHPERSEAVAYLARPCQFAAPGSAPNCEPRYWTGARYAPEIVESVSKAVDVLKENSAAKKIVLVGYSGGGALAVLLAAQRNDIAEIVTVAANLDLAYWTRRDGLTPLSGSLDPADVAAKVANIPQLHFSGERDDVAGPDVVGSFVSKSPPGAPIDVIEVPKFTHACCWVENWLELLASAQHF